MDARSTRPFDATDLDWPQWIPWGSAILVVVLAAITAYQHRVSMDLRVAGALAAVAAAPFVLESFRCTLPRWLTVVLTLVPTAVLLFSPAEEEDTTGFLMVMLAAQTAAVGTKVQGIVTALAACAVFIGVELAGAYHGAFIWIMGIILGWGCGYLMQWALRLLDDLRRADADLAERAAAEERRRIAREIHDVVAHTLSVTLLHVTGARMALQSDPAEAEAALREAEALGRRSLADVRRVVGLLRPDGEEPTAPPVPGGGAIAALVESYRAAGIVVALDVRGDVSSLPEHAGLAVYRVLQESLTNVSKHAARPVADVVIDAGPPLSIVVRSPLGPSAPERIGGHGIVGMRERAVAIGGRLAAGPSDDGREWVVSFVADETDAGART